MKRLETKLVHYWITIKKTYSANLSRRSCSVQPFSKLATNSVEHGRFPAMSPNRAICSGAVGDANAGRMGWC